MLALRRPCASKWMALVLVASLLGSSCQPIASLDLFDRMAVDDSGDGEQELNQPTPVDLARAIDSLERRIESVGSIVAEQPSVWGQARLTMYRQEFETTMAAQLNKFQATLQGTLSRTDQAYAADALALSYAASAASAPSTPSRGTTVNTNSANSSTTSTGSTSGGGGGGTVTGPPLPSLPSDLSSTFGAFQNVTRNPATLPTPLSFVGSTNGISLEPTIYLDQMKRYIDHLHELRRMSDGDDTADSPGYSLNLVRIPVSILPGKRTQERYGAEITFTMTPHLNPELLPMTFRNLVVNDLLDEIGVPLTQIMNDLDWDAAMDGLWSIISTDPCPQPSSKFDIFVSCLEQILESARSNTLRQESPQLTGLRPDTRRYQSSAQWASLKNKTQKWKNLPLAVGSSTKLRTAKQAFPPSEIVDIYGPHGWAEIVCAAWVTFQSDVANKGFVHYPDIQSLLQQELGASYNLMKLDGALQSLWPCCNPSLVADVYGRNVKGIGRARNNFETGAQAIAQNTLPNPGLTTALAWAILVDSALLNKQLVEDMVDAPAARGGRFNLPAFPPDAWPQFYLLNPGSQERDAFNEYVRCRWPIHVFSLDPEEDTQNVADSYSMRREMQFALSLAFVTGNLSASNMFQYARRLEMDMETIALNKTILGFSHGTETFGWRFYPRFQSPDIDNNFKTLFWLFWGGPDRRHLLRERMLEPGMRECVAIVLMPSFVPYADVEASSNWFALDNPRRKLMNSKTAIKLGTQLQLIKNCSQFVNPAVCCREGDIERLRARAEQLESRLPLQSLSVQVPYENTLGGFAMFNTGITDLAPELLGWYGAPGINLDAPTTIFLIGNHFSVHQTRVIVGGQEITTPELLSRQVMKVTIPASAETVIEKTGQLGGGWPPPLDQYGPLNQEIALCWYEAPVQCECKGCPPCDPCQPKNPDPTCDPVPPQPIPLVPQTSDAGSQKAGDDSGTGHVTLAACTPASQPHPASTLIHARPSQSMTANDSLVFPMNAIELCDPVRTSGTLSLTVNKGIITLGAGRLNGLSFISGANGSSSMAFTGTTTDLQAALNGMIYAPNVDFFGDEVLTIVYQGSGINSPCTVNVAIHVKGADPDCPLVDVQLATPYGATTHLLIPAWHLTSSGSGTTVGGGSGGSGSAAAPAAGFDASIASSKSATVSTPQWTTTQFALGYVNKGIGIVACDPPSFTPNALTIYLGTNYLTPPDSAVTLTCSLGSAANGKLPAQPIVLTSTNYDSTKHVLTIAGQDLVNLTNSLMTVVQFQFGASRAVVPPPTAFTVGTTITDFNNPNGFALSNKLTVNLVRAPLLPPYPIAP